MDLKIVDRIVDVERSLSRRVDAKKRALEADFAVFVKSEQDSLGRKIAKVSTDGEKLVNSSISSADEEIARLNADCDANIARIEKQFSSKRKKVVDKVVDSVLNCYV